MSLAAVDVHDLVGHPGASRRAPVTGTLEGLATEVVQVPEDVPVAADLLLESVVEGILVTGTIRGEWMLRCARCLTEFRAPFEVSVAELFASHADEDTDDYELTEDAAIQPDQMFRDAIGVEMPFSPLCRPDCAGLCETCGGNRNLGECPGHPQVDPRFAVLTELSLPDEN